MSYASREILQDNDAYAPFLLYFLYIDFKDIHWIISGDMRRSIWTLGPMSVAILTVNFTPNRPEKNKQINK